jgi:TonB family protein
MDRRRIPRVADPMSRRWLVAVSVVAHLAIGVGVFVSGVWGIERLHGERRFRGIGVLLPPAESSGGMIAHTPPKVLPKIPPKRTITHERRQPQVAVIPKEEIREIGTGSGSGSGSGSGTDPEAHCLENCGEAPPALPVCGNAAIETGEQCDDGNSINGDGCSSSCQTEARPKPQVVGIVPSVMQGLRISGETQVHPSSTTQTQMVHDDVRKVDATIKLCLDAAGGVASTKILRSTRYPDYDQRLLAAVADWRYRPYTFNNVAVPACSTVSFVYTINR